MSNGAVNNGVSRARYLIPLVVTVAGLAVSVALNIQGWAKDSGHSELKAAVEQNRVDIKVMQADLQEVQVNQATMIANQDSMQKTLDKMEKKLP